MAYGELLTVVNSDITTPLDELIKSQRAYGASDDILVVLSTYSYYMMSRINEDVIVDIQGASFTPTKSGSIRVMSYVTPSYTTTYAPGTVGVIAYIQNDDGTKEKVAEGGYSITQSNNGMLGIATTDIHVRAGRKYVFAYFIRASNSYNYATFTRLSIGAHIVDLSLCEYTTDSEV